LRESRGTVTARLAQVLECRPGSAGFVDLALYFVGHRPAIFAANC
jgi:hypothetical protein